MVTAKKADLTTAFTTPSDTEILVTRAFDAPRRLVFDAFTNPTHLPHWMVGPGQWVMHTCEIDLRPGGAYRYGWRQASGEEMQITGVFREVAPPGRLVATESWGEGWPETVNTVAFAEEHGKTTMTMRILYPSTQLRDAALESGMKGGLSMNFVYLDAYLRQIDGGAR